MMTRQEIFEKAVRGLASQGFEKCIDASGACVYHDRRTGHHCAWGWVDPSLDEHVYGNIHSLRAHDRGLIMQVQLDDLPFVGDLQDAHDGAENPAVMRGRLENMAIRYALVWPEGL